jgi:hypothetical protein
MFSSLLILTDPQPMEAQEADSHGRRSRGPSLDWWWLHGHDRRSVSIMPLVHYKDRF